MADDLSDSVWSERDTSPTAVEVALRELVTARAHVPARALNFVCIVERQWRGEIANRLRTVGRFHPSRTLVCSVSPEQPTLDAVASVSGSTALLETVTLELGPAHLERIATIVDPLLATDVATVVWAPHGHRDAVDALREISQVVLLDTVTESDAGLARAAALLQDRYVVDLAWVRTTPWRERLAAELSPRERETIAQLEVRHHHASRCAAMLLCGWLAAQLGWDPGLRGVAVTLEIVDQDVPGLAGVTVTTSDGATVSLDRGAGGLHAVRGDAGGPTHSWTLMGASRGEGGILGEGIRQSLLRDPVYPRALAAATAL